MGVGYEEEEKMMIMMSMDRVEVMGKRDKEWIGKRRRKDNNKPSQSVIRVILNVLQTKRIKK